MQYKLRKLSEQQRLRWYVLVVVVVGIGTSVALNVMDAPHNLAAQIVAGLPPVAVFTVIELMSRIPSSNRLLSAGRILASLVVAGWAGFNSWEQQVTFVTGLGFSGSIAIGIPVIIDGTMMVATLSLIELVRSIRTLRAELDVLAETQPELARARRDELEAPETLAYREEIERRRAAVRAARLNGHRIELEPVAVN